MVKNNLNFKIIFSLSFFILTTLGIADEAHAVVPPVVGGETVTRVRQDCSGYTLGSDCFTSLSSWEAAFGGIDFTGCTNGDLTCVNTSAVAEIEGSWTIPDTSILVINGWTTGVSNYIEIRADSGNEAIKTGWDANRYRLSVVNTDAIITYEDYIRLNGVQVEATYSSVSGKRIILIQSVNAVNDIRINDARLQSMGYSGVRSADADLNLNIYNTIIGPISFGGISVDGNTVNIYNSIISNAYSGISVNGSGTWNIKNNAIFNTDNDIIDGSGGLATINIDYNASDDGDGTNPISPAGGDWNNEFEDPANGDFTLLEGGNLVNAGTDLSTYLTTDIDGASRNASINAWDIGADETATQIFRSVGPGATAILESDTAHARNVTLTSGVATFSVALADNIGVGDAVLVDTNGGAGDQSITSADTLLFIHGRTDSTHYTVRTHTGATPADIASNDTYSIYRAYTSLSLAEAGTWNASIPVAFNGGNRDLVTNNEEWNIACYTNGTTADTTAVSINGWTTGVQNFIKVYTPVYTNEVGVSQRHSGKWDEGKYRLIVSNSNALAIFVRYIRIDGMQISVPATNGISQKGIHVTGNDTVSNAYYVSNNVIKGNTSNTFDHHRGISFWNAGAAGSTTYVWNNIVYDFKGGTGAIGIDSSDQDFMIHAVYNNTVYNCDVGFNDYSEAMHIKNNIAQGCVDGYKGLFNAASDYNISDLAADAPGSNSKNSTNVSFADKTNYDFHLSQSDTEARGAGANLTAEWIPASAGMTGGYDIDGQLRNPVGAGWDIGADEGTVEFTPTVMQSGGDYSTLSSWEAGVQTDLTATTTRVFSHGGKTGTIADNAMVTGQTSGAIATVVHATTNQILLEIISGTFVSGETVQVTTDNSVVISDNGNPASAVAKIDGAWTVEDDDNNYVNVAGWETGYDNYIKIYTTGASRHNGTWDNNKYIRSYTVGPALNIEEDNIIVDGLQVFAKTTDAGIVIAHGGNQRTTNVKVINNIIKSTGSGSVAIGIYGWEYMRDINVYNNIIYDFSVKGIDLDVADVANVNVYNNTIDNTGVGIYFSRSGGLLKNNLVQDCTTDYQNLTGSFLAASSNNISSDATAPGSSGSKINAQVKFISTEAGNEDFHLSPEDRFAIDAGVQTQDLASLQYDIDGQIRTGAWDIGADETATEIYRSVGPGKTDTLDNDTGHTKNVTLTCGLATFNVALPDNVGVGDVVIIDTAGTADTIDSADTLLFISKRNSATSYNLQTNTGATPANITINDTYQIYRAYTSLANAEAGTINSTLSTMSFPTFTGGNRDLVANNETWNIACYANGTTADTTAVMVDGWNTGALNYLKIYTPVEMNEVGVTQRHSGVWDDTKFRIEMTPFNNVLRLYDQYLRVDGLQIKMTVVDRDGQNGIVIDTENVHGVYVSNNIIQGIISGTSNNTLGIVFDYNNTEINRVAYIWNNIVYGFINDSYVAVGIAISSNITNAYVYNNTVYNSYFGFRGSDTGALLTNNLAQNCIDGFYSTFNASSDYNISNLAADAPGTNSKNLTTVNFIDTSSNNFCLSSNDTAAKKAGVNLSADTNLSFTDDIRGQSRPKSPDAWSIGACEVLDAQKLKLEGTQIKLEGDIKME